MSAIVAKMSIHVLFFGSTATTTGKRKIEIELAEGLKSCEIFESVKVKYPELAAHRLLFR